MKMRTYLQAQNYAPRTISLYERAAHGIDPHDTNAAIAVIARRTSPSGSWARITFSAVQAAQRAAEVPDTDAIENRIERPIARPALPVIHTRAEIIAAISTQPPAYRLALTLLYAAALRPAELLQLTPLDIEQDQVIIRNAKTGRNQRVPITPTLSRKLTLFTVGAPADRPIWPIGPRDLRRIWTAAEQRAGLRHLPLYSLRHAAAVHMIQAGYSIEQVRRHLRHANLQTTQTYLQCLPDQPLKGA